MLIFSIPTDTNEKSSNEENSPKKYSNATASLEPDFL